MLRPVSVDYLDGLLEARRLSEELGVDISPTPEQATALGRAIADQRDAQAEAPGLDLDPDPPLSDELAQALDRIVAERSPRSTWAEDVARHQGHRHARNETCTEDQAQTAPETRYRTGPRERGLGPATVPTGGKVGSERGSCTRIG